MTIANLSSSTFEKVAEDNATLGTKLWLTLTDELEIFITGKILRSTGTTFPIGVIPAGSTITAMEYRLFVTFSVNDADVLVMGTDEGLINHTTYPNNPTGVEDFLEDVQGTAPFTLEFDEYGTYSNDGTAGQKSVTLNALAISHLQAVLDASGTDFSLGLFRKAVSGPSPAMLWKSSIHADVADRHILRVTFNPPASAAQEKKFNRLFNGKILGPFN